MSFRSTILSQMMQVAEEQNVELPQLVDDLVLLDCGLDSLCFAMLVTRLEDALGLEPFCSSDDADLPVTLGDFISLYEDAANKTTAT
jgi:acyl carrier protein